MANSLDYTIFVKNNVKKFISGKGKPSYSKYCKSYNFVNYYVS